MIYATVAFALLLAFLAFERHQARLSTAALLSRLADLAMAAAPAPQPTPDLTVLVELCENLAQRLQAPAAAVAQHAASMTSDPLYAPPAVSIDSDEDYWGAVLTKEQMAEAAAAEELATAD
jgi:hypothetical protein